MAAATPPSGTGPRRRPARWLPWALVVTAVVAAAIIGGVALRADDPGRGPHVLVVGDSVIYQASADLVMTFDWTSNVEVQGRPGFRTHQLVPVALQAVADGDHEFVVVLTGYNDITQEVDTAAAVADMVEVVATVPCAIWVLLPTKGDYPPEAAIAFNDRVEDLVAERDQVHIETGWRDAADATDGPEPDPRLVSDDGVHPTDEGTAEIAEVIEAAVSRTCR